MMLVMGIHFIVQLPLVGQKEDNNFQNRNLHGSLVEVCGFILDHLHCNDLHCLHILALYHLCKRPLAKDVEYQVSKLEKQTRDILVSLVNA